MAKNRFSMHPNQQTPSMSPSRSNTVGAVASLSSFDEEEDSDICPVCDGECTCNNKPRDLAPLTMAELSLQYSASSSGSSRSLVQPPPSKPLLPSLKIKLTVPQSLLGKRRTLAGSITKPKNNSDTTYTVFTDRDAPYAEIEHPRASSSHLPESPAPKKRGRPPKASATRDNFKANSSSIHHSSSHGDTTYNPLPGKLHRPSVAKVTPKSKAKAKATIFKKGSGPLKRRRVASSDSSDLSDINRSYDPDDEDDAESVQFPTFVSASAISSISSDLSDSSLSDFDTDSSIEAEEENFILSEIHDKVRLRRELLGDDEGMRKGAFHNDWVIKSRKRSVGPSDVEMDVDSDATEQDEEDDDEEEAEDEDETDGRSTGAGYVGFATGWSEDEDDESSFDADLFFANLSGSDEGSSSSTDVEDGDEGDHSDISSSESPDDPSQSLSRSDMDHLPLEVTEGWDGQIVFTNGLDDSQGMLDVVFETGSSQFITEPSMSSSQNSDVEMSASDVDDNGYEEDADGGEGDTTDEELVGDDDLPNERAMRLFSLPLSVSAINPMSTVSPAVSPGPRDRYPFSKKSVLGSPGPADILSGKVFCDSDEQDELNARRYRSFSQTSSSRSGPRQGLFVPIQETRQAIIDGSCKETPSPHPRFNRGRGRMTGRFSTVEHLLRRHLLSTRPLFPTSSASSPLQLLSSSDVRISSPNTPATEPIELDDVLDASFLDPCTPEQHVSMSENSDGEAHKNLKNLNRWDHISVGAFRQTRETGALPDNRADWISDTPGSSADLGSMMKASPLSAMLWPNKKPKKKGPASPPFVSPIILPVRDGDRTPTNHPPNYQTPPQNQNKQSHKSRKELRRERKLKRKNYGPVQNQHQHHQYHSHHHHPNSKTRSTSAAQRSNFFSSIPPMNL